MREQYPPGVHRIERHSYQIGDEEARVKLTEFVRAAHTDVLS